jgi:hypothetical protein
VILRLIRQDRVNNIIVRFVMRRSDIQEGGDHMDDQGSNLKAGNMATFKTKLGAIDI